MQGKRSGRVVDDVGDDREALGLVRKGGNQVQLEGEEALREQDLVLDEIHEGVKEIGVMAQGIGSQIDNQREILEDVEGGLNRANTNLDHISRRTKDLIERSGGNRQFCIQICLGITALILLMLVLYL